MFLKSIENELRSYRVSPSEYPPWRDGRYVLLRRIQSREAGLKKVGMLVSIKISLSLICGKFLRVLNTTSIMKVIEGTAVMSHPNGKNFKNWIIRRRYLRPLRKVMVSVPTTTKRVDDRISTPK